jgi:hypothetical protein
MALNMHARQRSNCRREIRSPFDPDKYLALVCVVMEGTC